MKKILLSLLISFLLGSNGSICLNAMDQKSNVDTKTQNILQVDQDKSSKGFKAWALANPKKFAALVTAAIATIIGGGVVAHRVVKKHWLWEPKPKQKPSISKNKPEQNSDNKTQDEKSKEPAISKEEQDRLEAKKAEYLNFEKTVIEKALIAPKYETLFSKRLAALIEERTGKKLDDIDKKDFKVISSDFRNTFNDQNEANNIMQDIQKSLDHQMEAEKQSFDPNKITMDDVKKLEKVETFSISKLKGSIEWILSRVDADEMLTNQLHKFDAAINGNEEYIEYLNLNYPLLDFKKGKEMLEKALKKYPDDTH